MFHTQDLCDAQTWDAQKTAQKRRIMRQGKKIGECCRDSSWQVKLSAVFMGAWSDLLWKRHQGNFIFTGRNKHCLVLCDKRMAGHSGIFYPGNTKRRCMAWNRGR